MTCHGDGCWHWVSFRAGYTLVWSGWDPDAPRANHGLAMRVPVATHNGTPIVKTIRDEFVLGTRVPTTRLTAPLSYEAATLDQDQARLTVRTRAGDPRTDIPPSQWAYANARSIKLLPENTAFSQRSDFQYPAEIPKCSGLASQRRAISSLSCVTGRDRAGNANLWRSTVVPGVQSGASVRPIPERSVSPRSRGAWLQSR
jgi:hypothetical protein